MPVIPQYAYEEERTLKDDINDTAGINEASRGQLPSSSIPAIGMQLLVGRMTLALALRQNLMNMLMLGLAESSSNLVDKYYETERLLKIVGEDLEYTIRNSRAQTSEKTLTLRLSAEALCPGSKVLKRQEIINLHQQGYFGIQAIRLWSRMLCQCLSWG